MKQAKKSMNTYIQMVFSSLTTPHANLEKEDRIGCLQSSKLVINNDGPLAIELERAWNTVVCICACASVCVCVSVNVCMFE